MPNVRLRPIALPTEHGGWALVGAPILLGLWVAPSVSGACLGVASLAVFLARQPAGLALGDWRRRRRYPRTAWAAGFALGYVLVALAAFACAWVSARGAFWLPLALAAPLVGVQAAHDLASRGRALPAQVCGAAAGGAIAAAILMAAGWAFSRALVPWTLLALQSVAAVAYVGARLRLARGLGAARWPSIVAHLVSLVAAGALAWLGLAPRLGVLVFAVLAARAIVGLLPRSLATRTPMVGVQEVVYGLFTVAGLALGLRWGW